MKNQHAPWGDVLMLENPNDELYFGEVYRQIIQEAWLPEGAEVWRRLGKSRRGRRPTQQGLVAHSPTEKQVEVRKWFSLCSSAWRGLPQSDVPDPSCDSRYSKDYWWQRKQDDGCISSYYDHFMQYCMRYSLDNNCLPPDAYKLELTGDLENIDCDIYYPLDARYHCGPLSLTDGPGEYAASLGWRFFPCCDTTPSIGFLYKTLEPGEVLPMTIQNPESGDPGELKFKDENGARGCIDYGSESMFNCEYKWIIESGTGELSAATGISNVYTAADYAPGCFNNTVIKYWTKHAENFLKIGVNSYTLPDPAYGRYRYPSHFYDPACYCTGGVEWFVNHRVIDIYDCKGNWLYETHNGGNQSCGGPGCTCPQGAGGFNFYANMIATQNGGEGLGGYYWGKWNDLRTPEMIADGCCPGPLA